MTTQELEKEFESLIKKRQQIEEEYRKNVAQLNKEINTIKKELNYSSVKDLLGENNDCVVLYRNNIYKVISISKGEYANQVNVKFLKNDEEIIKPVLFSNIYKRNNDRYINYCGEILNRNK